MKKSMCIVCVELLLIGTVLFAQQDDAVPDFDNMERDVLVVLARNQHHKLAKLNGQVAELTAKVSAAEAATLDAQKSGEAQTTRVKELEAEVVKLRAIIDSDPKLRAKLTKQQEIEKATAEKRIVVGMTLEQANQAMGYEGKQIHDDGQTQSYEWNRFQTARSQMLNNLPPARSGGNYDNSRLLTGLAEAQRERWQTDFYNSWANRGKEHYIASIENGVIVTLDKF